MDNNERIFDVLPGEEYVDDRSKTTIFFQVLVRKFWKLITINLMYLVFNIPAILISFFFGAYILESLFPISSASLTDAELVILYMTVGVPAVFFLLAIPTISVGPAQAGMTYLLRCFSYEIPTFTWSDFKDKMKENLKQGLAVSLINLVIMASLILDIYLYSQLADSSNIILSAASVLVMMVFIIFIMMNMYIYPMMVTYELKLTSLYKNAFLFAIGKFLPNLGVVLICLLLIIGPVFLVQLTTSYLAIMIMYLYYILLGFTLPGYIINFIINPIIDRHMRPENKQE
ncbi:MAG: DUF624 domain-containing protein [Clostridiaceae bacterium]|nr:DUF624 domain-containing protein [Clostridiaceae bacterium]